MRDVSSGSESEDSVNGYQKDDIRERGEEEIPRILDNQGNIKEPMLFGESQLAKLEIHGPSWDGAEFVDNYN